MKKSVQLSVKSDLMSTLEYYKQRKMSFDEWIAKQYYELDQDRYKNDTDYKNGIDSSYKEYEEKVEYNNDIIEKLCDYLYKI